MKTLSGSRFYGRAVLNFWSVSLKKLHNVASDDQLKSMSHFIKDVLPWLPLPHICSLHISLMGEAGYMKMRGMRNDKRREKWQVTGKKMPRVHLSFFNCTHVFLPLRGEGEMQEKMWGKRNEGNKFLQNVTSLPLNRHLQGLSDDDATAGSTVTQLWQLCSS